MNYEFKLGENNHIITLFVLLPRRSQRAEVCINTFRIGGNIVMALDTIV